MDDAVSRHPLRPLGTEQVRCEVLSGLSRLRLCAPRIREAKAPWEGPLGVIVSPPQLPELRSPRLHHGDDECWLRGWHIVGLICAPSRDSRDPSH